METPLASLKIEIGDVIQGKFLIIKKLGQGTCGIVYLVKSFKDSKFLAAMKVEPKMKNKNDEILKMEVYVLKKLQRSNHVCHLVDAGKTENFNYMVITLLGKELSELRRRQPDRKLSTSSGLKIGLQVIQTLNEMHTVGFVHRDIKPSNFACGRVHQNFIILFDFGLARQILIPDPVSKKMTLREPREKVCFHGTVRYCSLNVHQYKEQGRHDDLWSMLFMLIELVTANLPWKGLNRKESGLKKEVVTDKQLLVGCPPSFWQLNTILKKLNYQDLPPYEAIRKLFFDDLTKLKANLEDPFEWEKKVDFNAFDTKKNVNKAEKDPSQSIEARDTNQEESIKSATSNEMSESSGFARENTLDSGADMRS